MHAPFSIQGHLSSLLAYHVCTCVFLCSRPFRIVYERLRVPEPELHRCKTGHLVEFHIPLELLSKQLCTPALSIMDILWTNLSAWPQQAKQKQNHKHNLINAELCMSLNHWWRCWHCCPFNSSTSANLPDLLNVDKVTWCFFITEKKNGEMTC